MNNNGNSYKDLKDLSRDLPFKTPEKYFDHLEERITDRIRQADHVAKKDHVVQRKLQIAWMSGVAAAIIGFLIALPLFFEEEKEPVLTKADIEEVLEQEIYDLDGFDLEYALLDQEMAVETFPAEYREEVIRYLLDEDIELETIVNEL